MWFSRIKINLKLYLKFLYRLQEAAEKKEGGSNSTETEDGEKKDDAWAKLGDTISSFFGGNLSRPRQYENTRVVKITKEKKNQVTQFCESKEMYKIGKSCDELSGQSCDELSLK